MKANKKLQEKLGDRIRQRRLSLGWSQERLASKAGLHEKGIGRIEMGNSNVTLSTLDALATAFDIEIGDLFDHSQRREGPDAAELHKLVDDASAKTRKLMLHLLRAVGAWRSGGAGKARSVSRTASS